MVPFQIVVWLIVGIIVGWLGGKLIKKRGFGLTGDVIAGIVGAFLGNLIIGEAIYKGVPGYALDALLGSIILLLIIKVIK
jgi:uncharacterized membrane protein YeaQ/YmgE (transglycosylase-associated protein family)